MHAGENVQHGASSRRVKTAIDNHLLVEPDHQAAFIFPEPTTRTLSFLTVI